MAEHHEAWVADLARFVEIVQGQAEALRLRSTLDRPGRRSSLALAAELDALAAFLGSLGCAGQVLEAATPQTGDAAPASNPDPAHQSAALEAHLRRPPAPESTPDGRAEHD